jgi:hypothetical protein
MFIHTYLKGVLLPGAQPTTVSRGQLITAGRKDAERLFSRWKQEQEGCSFTLLDTCPFHGETDHLQWVPSWELGQDTILFADVPVRTWCPQYDSEKMITKLLLVYNADHDEEIVSRTYTKEDDHLAEQHAEDFSDTVVSPSDFVRVIDIRGLQQEVLTLRQKVVSLSQQLEQD